MVFAKKDAVSFFSQLCYSGSAPGRGEGRAQFVLLYVEELSKEFMMCSFRKRRGW